MRFAELIDGAECNEFGRPEWHGSKGKIAQPTSDMIRLSAPAASDWFHDPGSHEMKRNAPMLLAKVSGPATLKATIQPEFVDTFDAGVLMAYEDDHAWAKLCFERAPDGRVLVVSVVTNGVSDDANAFEVITPSVQLRVSILGSAYAFHASLGGESWDLIRYFRLKGSPACRLGIGVQAPVGTGCSATFIDTDISQGAVTDIRNGA